MIEWPGTIRLWRCTVSDTTATVNADVVNDALILQSGTQCKAVQSLVGLGRFNSLSSSKGRITGFKLLLVLPNQPNIDAAAHRAFGMLLLNCRASRFLCRMTLLGSVGEGEAAYAAYERHMRRIMSGRRSLGMGAKH